MIPLVLALAGCSDYAITADPVAQCSGAPAVDVIPAPSCAIRPQSGPLVLTIEREIAGYAGFGPPLVGRIDDDDADGDIDIDDRVDIVWIDTVGSLVTAEGGTGRVRVIAAGVSDAGGGLAIADLDDDGFPEFIVTEGASLVTLVANDGAVRWISPVDDRGLHDFLYPAVADLDGDGYAEIIAGRTILDRDGNVLGVGTLGTGGVTNEDAQAFGWTANWWAEGSAATAADLDGDGAVEVVVGNGAYAIDGHLVAASGDEDGQPAIADLDGDGFPEIVVVSGNRVFTLDAHMRPTGWSTTLYATRYASPAAIDDLDGDGLPEIVVSGATEVYAWHGDGTPMWTSWAHDPSGAAGPAIADLDGDGLPEVIYADDMEISVLDGRTGEVRYETDHHRSPTGFETPVIADVDGDGSAEIIVANGILADGMGLEILGGDLAPARSVWNQHAYTLTGVRDDLSIPARGLPSWRSANRYRSSRDGPPHGRSFGVSAEIAGVCGCAETVAIAVRVHNTGDEVVPEGIPIVVLAGDGGSPLAIAHTPFAIAPGRSSDGIVVSFPRTLLGGQAAIVAVDRDEDGYGVLTECDEGDNSVAVPIEACE